MQAGLAVVCGQGLATAAVAVVSKKNLNAAKPPEQSKGLGGNIGCKVKKKKQNATRTCIPESGGKNVKAIRCGLPSTGDFDGNLRISLSTSYIQVVVRAGVIKLLSITQTDRGISP